MTEGRIEFTATLLRDGRVLAAGGGDSGTAKLATAELYDPGTGTWTATGKMTEARDGHTATLLLDGRVLVAGGGDGATAELYDPRTGTWTATGPMVGDHFYNAATLLPDGTVLVAGNSSEMYDPSTGTWTATGPMIHPHFDLAATLLVDLPDGTVLLEGGGEDGVADERSAELYDPRGRTWTATGALIDGRVMFHTATLLPDGTVLVAGGIGNGEVLDGVDPAIATAELYDPRTRTWTATVSMDAARRNHTATLLPDGRVLVVGGYGAEGVAFTAELSDRGGDRRVGRVGRYGEGSFHRSSDRKAGFSPSAGDTTCFRIAENRSRDASEGRYEIDVDSPHGDRALGWMQWRNAKCRRAEWFDRDGGGPLGCPKRTHDSVRLA